ncbi:tail protein [Escherichia phage KW1E_UTAR]|nr:tail protein [Escherichia phage KW1E_UTAR]
MGYQLPNGSTVMQSKTLSAPANITDISNAVEPVVTLAAAITGLVPGEYVLINSAWTEFDNGVFKVKAVDGTDVTLEAANSTDTTDTDIFPAGAGTGTMRRVVEWVPLPYITDVNTAGGDQQNTSFQPLQLDRAITLNTFKNGFTQTFTITHDSSDAIRPDLEAADRSQEVVAVKFYNPRAKENRMYGAQVSFSKIPVTQPNQVETCAVTYSLQSDMRFYKDA